MLNTNNFLIKKNIPNILFDKIIFLQKLLLENLNKDQRKIAVHLTDLKNAYNYIYYIMIVDYFLKNNKKELIVDWGGFIGQITMLLNSIGYNCENYVLNYPNPVLKNLIDTNYSNLKINFKKNTGNIKQLSYANESCFGVISSGVLEHVHENNTTDRECLNEIYRILKPNGYFFCWNLPRKLSLLENICKIRKKDHHEILYSDNKFKKILKETGFKLIFFERQDSIFKIIKPIRNYIYNTDPWQGFVTDYKLSKLPLTNLLSHHITAVYQKI
jgi:ubiquinone/menaquinone biosynthesis C-methylase UbiE